MAAEAGRNMRIKYDADGAGGSAAVVIAGARTDGLTIENTFIPITDKDDAGIPDYVDDTGTQTVSLNCEGVMTGTTLLDLAKANGSGNAKNYFEVAIGSLATVAGNFLITNFSASGEDGDNPITFTCTLTSAGSMTWT
jgi:predicted secreted protein